jgi:uncharacterized protein (TIGR02265 family)
VTANGEAPVVFKHTAQSLKRVLEPVLNVDVARQFVTLGMDFADLSNVYPLDTWTSALRLAMKVLFPKTPEVEAQYALGERFISAYAETLVGKIVAATSRLLGPKRALLATARNLHSGNNYSKVTIQEAKDGEVRFILNIAPLPHYFSGMFARGAEISGGKNPVCAAEKYDEAGVHYIIRWS